MLKNILLIILTLVSLTGYTFSSEYAGKAEAAGMTYDGFKRTYLVYVPELIKEKKEIPLLIALHGGFGNGKSMEKLSKGGFNKLADEEGFIVCYPDGINRRWNDGRKEKDNWTDDVGFLKKLILHLAEKYPVDRTRVYFTGMSNGSMMSQRMAIEASDMVAAIAGVGGSLPLNLKNRIPQGPVPVLYIHGDKDPLCVWEGGKIQSILSVDPGYVCSVKDTVGFWIKHNRTVSEPEVTEFPDLFPEDGTTVRLEEYAAVEKGAPVVFYRIKNGGHTWPRGNGYAAEKTIGITSQEMDANRVIWAFLKKYSLSSLPGAEQIKSQTSIQHVTSSGVKRTYVIHIPKGYDPEKKYPLLMMFHGGGGDAAGTIRDTQWNVKADKEGFFVVYPEGTPPDRFKAGNFRKNPQTWNDGSKRENLSAVKQKTDDVRFVRDMIQDISGKFSIDPKRIYSTGFSNGASMTYRLMREMPDLLAAAAPVAGGDFMEKTKPGRAVPVLYITGTKDPLNPYAGGPIRIGRKQVGTKPPVEEVLKRWVEIHGCDPEEKITLDTGGAKARAWSKEGREMVVLFTFEGHGHHWPGGTVQLPAFISGLNTAKLKATDLIWNFFKKHKLD